MPSPVAKLLAASYGKLTTGSHLGGPIKKKDDDVLVSSVRSLGRDLMTDAQRGGRTLADVEIECIPRLLYVQLLARRLPKAGKLSLRLGSKTGGRHRT